ncbi:hypothetical protein IMY05_018G0036800 [Salix suchowensis]|nr:hypothetical protein IMY05_018G0036800 [Salix suchowensis]
MNHLSLAVTAHPTSKANVSFRQGSDYFKQANEEDEEAGNFFLLIKRNILTWNLVVLTTGAIDPSSKGHSSFPLLHLFHLVCRELACITEKATTPLPLSLVSFWGFDLFLLAVMVEFLMWGLCEYSVGHFLLAKKEIVRS